MSRAASLSTTDTAGKTLYGYLAEFETPEQVLAAAMRVRDAGYRNWDVHTPFPIHGMDEAMDIKPTLLPWLVLGGGATGLLAGLGLQWWTNAVDYPFLISGKPYFSLPANIPVIFELTVLLSAFAAFGGMLVLNGLPQLYHALFTRPRFLRATQDRFFISIEARDPKFDPAKTRAFLETLGGAAVEEVEE